MMKEAQEWSEFLLKQGGGLQHSTWEKRHSSQGENLAWIWSSNAPFNEHWDTSAPRRWYDEIVDYDFETGNSKNGGVIGHFTQVVWKDT